MYVCVCVRVFGAGSLSAQICLLEFSLLGALCSEPVWLCRVELQC